MAPLPIIDHLEKLLADSYRKEIEQEENIWRSLPFFVASLALQIAALGQIDTGWQQAEGWGRGVIVAGSLVVVLATVLSIGFLAGSIYWGRFRYIATEPHWLDYATGLERDEAEAVAQGRTFDALAALKRALAEQYAGATDSNRRINRRRTRLRSVSGLTMLISVLATLTLVGWTRFPYIVDMAQRIFGVG